MSARILVVLGLLLSASVPLSAQCEIQLLKGRNLMYKDFFGKSCDLEGERLVVGAFASTTTRPGSAHVFERQGGIWIQLARLVPSDGGPGDEFGNSVGISGDAVIVGSEFNDNAFGSNTGAAYIFERAADGSWNEVQKLFPLDVKQSLHFAEYVAIEGSVAVAGGRILMASYRSDASGGHSGSAYLFEKLNGKWTEVARLVANDGAGELSRGVAIDGDRVVLGARLDSTLGDAAGAGYVFEKVNGKWEQTAKLLPRSARALDWIGEAVAVDGDRIVLSGHHHDQIGSNSGVAFVFERVNEQWVETRVLQSSTASQNDEFSFALSLSGDTLLATSPFDGGNIGSAYVFSFQQDLCSCGSAGAVTSFGENLGGANTGRLATESLPNPNTTMLFSITGIPNGTTGTLFLGPVKTLRPALGGTVLVPSSSAPIKLPFRLSAGSATVGWRVPLSLCGTTLYAQAVAMDASQALGRTLTNGLELVIGD